MPHISFLNFEKFVNHSFRDLEKHSRTWSEEHTQIVMFIKSKVKSLLRLGTQYPHIRNSQDRWNRCRF